MLQSLIGSAARSAARVAAQRARERQEALRRAGYRCPSCGVADLPRHRPRALNMTWRRWLRDELLGALWHSVSDAEEVCPKCGSVVDVSPWLAGTEFATAPKATGGYRCAGCGSPRLPVSRRRGSTIVEIVLYCMWILPGIPYSIWRSARRHMACPDCDRRVDVAALAAR